MFSHIGLLLELRSFRADSCPVFECYKVRIVQMMSSHLPIRLTYMSPKLHYTETQSARGFPSCRPLSRHYFFKRSQSSFTICRASLITRCQKCHSSVQLSMFSLDQPPSLSKLRATGARRCEICLYGVSPLSSVREILDLPKSKFAPLVV